MSRKNFIDAISAVEEISKAKAESILKTIEGLIVNDLKSNGEYQLLGIGKLKVKSRAARTGRNPKTGEPLQISASNAVTFTTAKALKEALNP